MHIREIILIINIILMDIGSAIAVFLILSIVLLALFCFITKYFHYKLKKALEQSDEVYSMVDQLCQQSETDSNGEYDDFNKKRKVAKLKSERKSPKEQDRLIEMSDLKEPIRSNQNIYADGALRKRLNGDGLQMTNRQQSNRSISQLKSFRPDKINTMRTDRTNKSQDSEVTKHSFVNKLVCYDSHGITTIDVIVISIKKIGQVIKENKKYVTNVLSYNDDNLNDQLQIIGFYKNEFGCYKYETKVEVSNMKANEDYMIRSLKTSESKSLIDIQEYLQLKKDITSEI